MMAVVIYAGGVNACPLEGKRSWVIGRGRDADISVDDASVSRRHAILHGGPPYELEDLGSENGTTIAKHDGAPSMVDETLKLATRRLVVGERIELADNMQAQFGRVTLVLQPGTAAGAPWQAPAPATPTPLPASVIAVSPAMQRVYFLAERFAQGAINILLLGETGVGKEVLAEHIHRASPRRAGPFVRLNCASFRGELLESELFGHERGAFTGAVAAKPGLVEQADGGTLLLDEIGETPTDVQSRLLRFLEDRRALRIGATEPRPVDVRIVSATNRDLSAEIAAGRFRSDLYFRLDGVALEIPPLRERRVEIAPLARHFIRLQAAALGMTPPKLDPAAVAILERHPFPGNARELRNLIERALLLCEGGTLTTEHLMLETPPREAEPATLIDEDEKTRVLAALDECAGNQTRAAAKLGITRRALIVRLERYGVPRPRR
jgi:DNA-binding NtrC family response regulator